MATHIRSYSVRRLEPAAKKLSVVAALWSTYLFLVTGLYQMNRIHTVFSL